MSNSPKTETVTDELKDLAARVGIVLDATQLNIGGERDFLSPNKFVLSGTHQKTGARAILKCAKHPDGIAEIAHEHKIMRALKTLPFSTEELIAPTETFYGTVGSYTVSVTDFIEQQKVYTDFSIEEQFFMAIHALESQETFHATTREHQGWVRDLFTAHTPAFYINDFKKMATDISRVWPDAKEVLEKGALFLEENRPTLDVFDRYLIHFDLVPHNFRINNRQLYLLDFVSFRLGNKYESWARFINFMEIHNPALVPYMLEYVKADRGAAEYLSLRLMRVYKATFLLNYHKGVYEHAESNLKQLAEARLTFWTHVTHAILEDKLVDTKVLETYYEKRAALRTEEEKERQRQFTWTN